MMLNATFNNISAI